MKKTLQKNVKLVVAMADRGLTNRALALAAGINPRYMTQVLCQRHEPTPITQGKIARALGLPVIELFHGGNP